MEAIEETPPKTARHCTRRLRRAVIAEFDGLIEGFLKEARKGSCAHIKFAVDLLRPEPRAQAATPGSSMMLHLLEELQREPADPAESPGVLSATEPNPSPLHPLP